MPAVSTCKQYQSDVENILYIHILGKLRQISEQSRTELFDIISNNVVDIIKPEEVDDLIKEGIVEHKDDVIQVQIYGLIYLIYTCNSRWLVPNKYGKLMCRATNYRKLEENTKHVLIDLPKFPPKLCIDCYEKQVWINKYVTSAT